MQGTFKKLALVLVVSLATVASAVASSGVRTTFDGNKSCEDFGLVSALRVDPVRSGTFTNGSFSATLTVHRGNPATFDFVTSSPVTLVLVKSGTGGFAYSYPSGTTADSGLESPNDEISHVDFCVSPPTAVDVQNFRVTRTATGAHIVWRSGAALNVLGYNVLRANGTRVNAHLITASGEGVSYRLIDRKMSRSYTLRVLHVNGSVSTVK